MVNVLNVFKTGLFIECSLLEFVELGNIFSKQANFRFAFIRPSNFSLTNKRYLEKIDKISIILDLSCMYYHELLNKVETKYKIKKYWVPTDISYILVCVSTTAFREPFKMVDNRQIKCHQR